MSEINKHLRVIGNLLFIIGLIALSVSSIIFCVKYGFTALLTAFGFNLLAWGLLLYND